MMATTREDYGSFCRRNDLVFDAATDRTGPVSDSIFLQHCKTRVTCHNTLFIERWRILDQTGTAPASESLL
jgi:hypothetical protein